MGESLTEGCISNIISFTSPRDACRLSLVSTTFSSAVNCDSVWESFLPPDCLSIISNSCLDSSSLDSLLSLPSKRELFFSLCHSPILIDDCKKSFWLDKWSGKKCYMIAARDLQIAWGNDTEHWTWTTLPDSRFSEVAELQLIWCLDIRGKIDTSMLSPKTSYAAYLVFKFRNDAAGFNQYPTEVSIGTATSGRTASDVLLALDWLPRPERRRGRARFNTYFNMQELKRPNTRRDGWLEMELGEYFNLFGGDGELEMRVTEALAVKSGIIVQAFEIRPKFTM